MKSKEEILAIAQNEVSNCCIYFLIDNDEIVYVGKTMHITSRVITHKLTKKFDRVSFISCSKEEMEELEKMYIEKFSPRINEIGRLSQTLKPGLIRKNAK